MMKILYTIYARNDDENLNIPVSYRYNKITFFLGENLFEK